MGRPSDSFLTKRTLQNVGIFFQTLNMQLTRSCPTEFMITQKNYAKMFIATLFIKVKMLFSSDVQ